MQIVGRSIIYDNASFENYIKYIEQNFPQYCTDEIKTRLDALMQYFTFDDNFLDNIFLSRNIWDDYPSYERVDGIDFSFSFLVITRLK